MCYSFFFSNMPATTAIYTLSLHDALPICIGVADQRDDRVRHALAAVAVQLAGALDALELALDLGQTLLDHAPVRSEEHTSELQSRENLVCRLLLEKKKKKYKTLSHDNNPT